MSCLIDVPMELFLKIFYSTVGVQQQLPPHSKWTEARLRQAAGFEIMRARQLSLFLSVSRDLCRTAIDVIYLERSFVLNGLNKFQIFIENTYQRYSHTLIITIII